MVIVGSAIRFRGVMATCEDPTCQLTVCLGAAELVTSFLLPEVEKETQRQQVKEDQRKFLQSAHQVRGSRRHRVVGIGPGGIGWSA